LDQLPCSKYVDSFHLLHLCLSLWFILCRRIHNTRTSIISTAQYAKLCHNVRCVGHPLTTTGKPYQHRKMTIISIHSSNNIENETETHCIVLVLQRSPTRGLHHWLLCHLERHLQLQARMLRGLVHLLAILLLQPHKFGVLPREKGTERETN
jgi:hypothetical protein